MRISIPTLLSVFLAVTGAGGLVLIAAVTKAGSAPGNGEQTFDAPGCQRNEYDGPGLTPRFLLNRDCPRPTGVILARSTYERGAWRVSLDGTRSVDPVGGRIVKYEWITGPGPRVQGARISIGYTHPGTYTVVLVVTDDSGSTGTANYALRLG